MEFLSRFLSSRIAVGGSAAVLLLLVAAAVFRIIPWWLFVVIVVLCIVGVVAYGIVSEWMALRRDGVFERGMNKQAQSDADRRKARDRDAVRQMHDSWQEGLVQLRESRLGKRRRALYFLPWYLIIGKPSTGKTTALVSSGLHFPLGVPKTKGTGGTRNCDWFFAEEAILLDTAGRYTQSAEQEADREEWLAFLGLLRKYRRDMPINGLLVAVAADDLLGKDQSEIVADARQLRTKLDELIQRLGIQFPVYLLITKCDLIQGFTDFFGRLPKARLTELLGWTNPSWEMGDVGQLLEGAFAGLLERTASLRPLFLRDEQDAPALRNVYLFPEELRTLTQNLSHYCDVLFRETKYNESPFLRGIYLTSALQTGTAISRMLERLGISAQGTKVSEGSRSYFLQDFFQERLKADQQLIAPTGHASLRLRIANNLTIGAVAVICLVFGLFATAAYVRNRTLLISIEDSVAATGGLRGQPPPRQVAVLGDYMNAVETLRYRNRHRAWLERFGLYSGAAVEQPVVGRFMRSYDDLAYRPALTAADAALRNKSDLPQAFAALEALTAHLVSTKAARTADLESGGEPLVPWWNAEAVKDEETRSRFSAEYRFYVREPWRPDGDVHAQEPATQQRLEQLALVRDRLPELLNVDTVKSWLEKKRAPVRAAELDLPPGAAGDAHVQPAFTPAAWQEQVAPMLAAVQPLQEELDTTVPRTFAKEYAAQYYGEWLKFLLALRSPSSAGSYDVRRYCDARSPYVGAFTSVVGAASIKVADSEPPAWVGALGRIVGEKDTYFKTVEDTCRSAVASGEDGSTACAQSVRFGGANSGLGAKSMQQLRDDVRKWVGPDGASDPDDKRMRDQVTKLLLVPVELAAATSVDGCKRHLDAQLRQALARFPARPPWTLEQIEAIFAPGRGAVWQYCEQTLQGLFDCQLLRPKPGAAVTVPSDITAFLERSQRISRLFFDYGGGWKKHTMVFESVPSSDIDTGPRVTQTCLTVSCSDLPEQPWTVCHRNTLVKKPLTWAPDRCDETRLRLTLGTPSGDVGSQQVIEKAKPGPFGLLDFLAEARRSGDDFRWMFVREGVTAEFRVSLREPELLDYVDITLPQ